MSDAGEPIFPRPFTLLRSEDATGVSGIGHVAWGVLFPDGVAVTRWCVSAIRQTCVWASIDDLRAVHGHDGKTQLIFHDEWDDRATGPDMPPEAALRLGLVEAGLLDPAEYEMGGPDDTIGLV
jgi:hypothetical protein